MQIITGITDSPKQNISIPLPDGTSISFALEFMPQQLGWFFDLAYSAGTINFQVNGTRLCASPNVLRQYQKLVPFGLACLTTNKVEPTTQTAFTDGTVTLLLLDPFDIAAVEDEIKHYSIGTLEEQYGFTVGAAFPTAPAYVTMTLDDTGTPTDYSVLVSGLSDDMTPLGYEIQLLTITFDGGTSYQRMWVSRAVSDPGAPALHTSIQLDGLDQGGDIFTGWIVYLT